MPIPSTGDAEDEDWSGLFTGIEALAAQPSMRRAWLRGLTDIAPADALIRLLGVVNRLPAVRKLPPEVVDAAIARPSRRVRLQLAEFQRGMSIDQWVRLIASGADEPRGALHRRFRALAVWHCPKVPVARFERWARDPDPRIRLRSLWFRGLPAPLAAALAEDPDPEVRAEACGYAWPHLDADRRSALADDPSPQVREVARRRAAADRPMSRTEFDALTTTEQWHAAGSRLLGRDLAEHLVHHPDSGLRATLVDNERLDADLVTALAGDDDTRVRVAVAARPDVTEELRAEISAGLPAYAGHWRVGWVDELHDDPDSTGGLAERFAGDPHEPVRERAAADTRLSSATLLRLLDSSTPRTRRAAIRNPRLPVPALVRLLRDPDTAEAAAGNPALPAAVVHRLIDLACPAE